MGLTQLWVRATGRRTDLKAGPRLDGIVGTPRAIDRDFLHARPPGTARSSGSNAAVQARGFSGGFEVVASWPNALNRETSACSWVYNPEAVSIAPGRSPRCRCRADGPWRPYRSCLSGCRNWALLRPERYESRRGEPDCRHAATVLLGPPALAMVRGCPAATNASALPRHYGALLSAAFEHF